MRRLLAAPALHFLVSGALLWAGDRWLLAREPAAPAPARIEISAERVASLRADWLAQRGTTPDARVFEALVEAEIDSELLLAEARARGLEADDPVIRARLARNLGFLDAAEGESENPRAGAPAQVEQALSLGLARGDLVIRRRLLERMRAELAREAGGAPSEAELEARFARDAAQYLAPARVRLSHVFFSRDRRGAALEADAQGLRARIAAESLDIARAIELGDPFLLGHEFPLRSEDDLARAFGDGFARAAFALEAGVFSAPVASSYGLHVVFVHERRTGTPATLESVRAALSAELAREHEAATLRGALDELRARYEIRVAKVEP